MKSPFFFAFQGPNDHFGPIFPRKNDMVHSVDFFRSDSSSIPNGLTWCLPRYFSGQPSSSYVACVFLGFSALGESERSPKNTTRDGKERARSVGELNENPFFFLV